MSDQLVPDPYETSLEDWQQTMLLTFPEDELPFPNPDWREWAVSLYSRGSFLNRNVPDPYGSDDWRSWGASLRLEVN